MMEVARCWLIYVRFGEVTKGAVEAVHSSVRFWGGSVGKEKDVMDPTKIGQF